MKQQQEEKQFLNLAGEYGVCSELAKRHITASITYGNHKAADILIVNSESRKALVVEVKTTRSNRIVTGFFQKYHSPETPHPDFWVIVHVDNDNVSSFYVLLHEDMAQVQMSRNKMSSWEKIDGVDNVSLDNIKKYHNNWEIIESRVKA